MEHSRSGSYDPPSLIRRNSPLAGSPGAPHVVDFAGRSFIPPTSSFARAVVMGNEASTAGHNSQSAQRHLHEETERRPASNLTLLLNRQQQQAPPSHRRMDSHESPKLDEADSASGPRTRFLGSSAPLFYDPTVGAEHAQLSRQNSTGGLPRVLPPLQTGKVRRCLSSRELVTIAPPSGSPYMNMMVQKEQLEASMRERLQTLRQNMPPAESPENSTSSRRRETANELRNRRRAEHNREVVDDLCNIVADLFLAESKLLQPSIYGVADSIASPTDSREEVVEQIRAFVSALPLRYALGADTPSEVLLHMRLLAAVRADRSRVAVHIHNLTDDGTWTHAMSVAQRKHDRSVRLVTISCKDVSGLLEFISRLLATGGSRVLDADVMLTKDGIVLDRFVVEMKGRLRLDRLSNSIEAFLKEKSESTTEESSPSRSDGSPVSPIETGGPVYYEKQPERTPQETMQRDMEAAVPFTTVLASSNQLDAFQAPVLPQLRRPRRSPESSTSTSPHLPNVQLQIRREPSQSSEYPSEPSSRHKKRLVDRPASSNLDDVGVSSPLDYMTVPTTDASGTGVVNRVIPLIPFEEIMLIETLGAGRVSTIYRGAWQRRYLPSEETLPAGEVHMIALKVAMVNVKTGDTAHVDELRREADIAARLNHPNICPLVGVAADEECFCLAYEYCEGGSLLSLLSDSSRYYEYLPIALDIANGMAYLHSRNVIHRDLKPSNVLLSRDHRAKISDFGMSVANTGQELTAETGTYRYMAPEVIRHESYSSNADVYSFGICLWQLITREIPFATMTPIQAAYAVAEGRRPEIPHTTPRRLQEIIVACWDQESHRRPSFTYIAMALADYAKMAFSPANVGALSLSIANEMLATVEGNSTVNVDFSVGPTVPPTSLAYGYSPDGSNEGSQGSNVGLEIE